MVCMIVTKEHQYAGRRLYPGQTYECEPQHVELMTKLGWARAAEKDKDEEPSGQQYDTRMMTAKRPRRRRGRAQ